MTDPLRSDASAATAGVSERDRNARLEELLLNGLDHYFAGQHELAINVWTRVLFLDRGHARARAYIERARSAVAERQREGEELVHTGAAAFHRGEADAARQLLSSAVERGAGTEEAFALLDRLDRLKAGDIRLERPAERRPDLQRSRSAPGQDVDARRSPVAWIAAGAVLGIAAGALAITLMWARGEDWLSLGIQSVPPTAVRAIDEPLPVPSTSETVLGHARALRAAGRFREALFELEAIRPGDTARAQADELRAFIQRQLLDAARNARPTTAPRRDPPEQETGSVVRRQ